MLFYFIYWYNLSITISLIYRFGENFMIKAAIDLFFKILTMNAQQNWPHFVDVICCNCFELCIICTECFLINEMMYKFEGGSPKLSK